MVTNLSEKDKKKLKERFNHLMVTFRSAGQLKQEDVARELGYVTTSYSQLERGQKDTIVNAYELFHSIAQLLDKNVTDVVQILEGIPVVNRANLSKNEALLLEQYSLLPSSTRRIFMKSVCSDFNRFQSLIDLSLQLRHVSVESIRNMSEMIDQIRTSEGNQ